MKNYELHEFDTVKELNAKIATVKNDYALSVAMPDVPLCMAVMHERTVYDIGKRVTDFTLTATVAGEEVKRAVTLSCEFFARDNDAKAGMKDDVQKLVYMSANHSTDYERAVGYIVDYYRLAGCGTLAIQNDDAKKVLKSAYKLNMAGNDDSMTSAIKQAMSGLLCRIAKGSKAINAVAERERIKAEQAKLEGKEKETTEQSINAEGKAA